MRPEDAQRFVLIGLGGVGGLVLRLLVPFLHHERWPLPVLCVDGDAFEPRNRARMWFDELGPKASVLAEELARDYGDRVPLVPIPHYVTPQRARALIQEGDVVFCAPDNHATRRLVERRCGRLADVALFSGGNDGVEGDRLGTQGNVQIYLRAGGRDVTNPISTFHPEIAKPGDRVPGGGCAAATPSAPQILFTNASVAASMLGAFYAWHRGALDYEEAYLDVVSGRHVPVRRKLQSGGGRARRLRAIGTAP
jgi:hypothetical protein